MSDSELRPEAYRTLSSATRLHLRRASPADIETILRLERIPEFRALVGSWPEPAHRLALDDSDVRYLLVLHDGDVAGFAILRGLSSPHHSVELKRFVIGNPDAGLGQPALRALMDYAFTELRAHRLWLDVFQTNARALHVYRKAGFQVEGTLREAIYRDGEYHSLFLLSILDREYVR